MDALPALRQLTNPDLSRIPLPKGAQEAIGKALSGSELATLKPTTDLPSLGGVQSGGASFENTLSQFVAEVGGRQEAASQAVSGLLSGQNVPLHQAMIAMEEASVSFQLMVEVRNKLLESYQELMRMQI